MIVNALYAISFGSVVLLAFSSVEIFFGLLIFFVAYLGLAFLWERLLGGGKK